MSADDDGSEAGTTMIAAIAAELQSDLAKLAEESMSQIRQDLPSYAVVSDEQLYQSIDFNLRRSTEAILAGGLEGIEDAENRTVPAHRLQLGVPISDIIAAYRISISRIHDRFIEVAHIRGLQPSEMLRALQILWELGDWYTRGVASEYRHRVAQAEIRDAFSRTELVLQLLERSTRSPDFPSQLRAGGLDPALSYRVLLGREHAEGELGESGFDALRAALSRLDGRDPFTAIVGSWSIIIVRATARLPESWTRGTWSLGPAASLLEIADSMDAAEMVHAALLPGQHGIFQVADLGWRMVSPLHPHLAAYLRDTYLSPIEAMGKISEDMFETLTCFVDQGLNVRRTAEQLVVHQNTVRYRVERCEDVWGRALRGIDVVVEVAMALELRRHEDASD